MAQALRRLSGLIIAVLAGCIYMVLAEAPRSYLLVNGGALVCAIGFATFLKRPSPGLGSIALTGIAVLFCIATLFSRIEIEGVQRWIGVGPIRLHAGLLLLPVIVSFLPDLRKILALLTVFVLGLTISLQPDRAAAVALLLGVLTLATAKRDRWSFGMLAVAAMGCVGAFWQQDPLQPVQFVEYVMIDAWQFHPLIAIILSGALMLAFVLPLRGLGLSNNIHLFAAMATIMGFAIMSLLGPYPTPLIGYGASAIIGYGFVLGLATSREIVRGNGS